MTSWPIGGIQRWTTLGVDAAASTGATVTASSTINTMGAWTELSAATPHPTSMVQVFVRGDTPFAGYAIDIGVGGAGSETVLIPNLLVQARNDAGFVFQFPIAIPAGTRVSARCQSGTVSATCRVAVLAGAPTWDAPAGFARVVAMGVDLADTGGSVTVDPGAVLNTKGAWVQVVASSEARIRGLVLMAAGRANTALSDVDMLLDIGVGGAGSETVLISNLPLRSGSASDSWVPGTWPLIPVDIPAGTRVAARAQASSTDASDRPIELAVYGVV